MLCQQVVWGEGNSCILFTEGGVRGREHVEENGRNLTDEAMRGHHILVLHSESTVLLYDRKQIRQQPRMPSKSSVTALQIEDPTPIQDHLL